MKSFSLGATRALCLLFGLMISALVSSSLMATDCTSDYIELNSQARIDSFQSNYGGGGTCDTVPGTLRIGGPDVVDLTPLAALTTVRDQFQIRQTNNLVALDGLSALTSVGGDQTDAAGSFYIFDNAALTNFIGLSGLVSVGGTLFISDNPVLTSVDGMSSLTSVHGLEIGNNDSLTALSGISVLVSGSVSWSLEIGGNDALTNLNALSALTSVGGMSITHNYALANLDGLAALTSVERALDLRGNTALTNLDGLSALTNVGGLFQIIGNTVLTDIDGLSALASVGSDMSIKSNELLGNCVGLARLVDQWDDAESGPGPGVGGVPDVGGGVSIEDNLSGCNSVEEILATVNPSKINPGLNDAWYDPETNGQGFFITVFPDLSAMSLAWFTYDTELPPIDATANLGDPGHRWITAVGLIEGNQVVMDIEMTSGGLFDTATEITRTDPPGSDGTIILTFDSCNSGTVEYDIPSISRFGTVPIQRIATDNVALCEALNGN